MDIKKLVRKAWSIEYRREIRGSLRRLFDWMVKRWYVPVLMVISALLLMNFRRFFIIAVMLAVNIAVGSYKRFVPVYLGIEPTFLFCMAITFAIGPLPAIVFAFGALLGTSLIKMRFTVSFLSNLAGFIMICLAAHAMRELGLMLTAKILVVIVNAIFFLLELVLADPKAYLNIPGEIIHIVITYKLVGTVGAGVYNILS